MHIAHYEQLLKFEYNRHALLELYVNELTSFSTGCYAKTLISTEYN